MEEPTMLPSGMVTFLFTDIEGSTPLWERDAQAMKKALARHNAILHAAIADNGGRVFKVIGDAFQAAFPLPLQAITAALAAQRALATENWGESGPLSARIGIHCAPGEIQEGDYAVSHDLNRVARIMAAGHGGQILISRAAAELVRRDLGEGEWLKDLGEHLLKGLAQPERLYQLVASGLPASFPALASQSAPRHNLPRALTPLTGREADLERITALLQDPACQLVTLAGPGGIGKTRLAIRAAEELLAAFPQGAWFAPLASLDSADFLAQSIATALGLPLSESIAPMEQLIESLSWKQLLLVLDNFEQLLPQGTELLIQMLHAAPGVKLLVTSREKLNLQAEWLFEVHGLAYPKDGVKKKVETYPAPALFLERARRVGGQAVPAADMACVAHIARLVEGSPLALELAAAWTRMLSCPEIAAEIERGLGFLEGRQPDLPERHRSMRVVFEHSWRLLPEEERSAFRRLAVFRGGFERQAAEQVAGASLGMLASLVDKSLVQHNPGGRYRIHELLRQFAAEELERAGEMAATRERHLAYFLGLAEQAEPELWRDQEKIWLDRLEAEHDNLRKALRWSLSAESDLGIHAGLTLLLAIEQFLLRRGHYREAASWLAELLGHPKAGDNPEIFANSLRLSAFLNYWAFGKLEEARGQFERSLAIAQTAGKPLILAHVLNDFGNYYRDTINNPDGDLSISQVYLKRALGIYRDLGHQPGIATVLRRLGRLSYWMSFWSADPNDLIKARSYNQESLDVWRALGNKSGIALALHMLGRYQTETGRIAEARVFLDQSLALFRELNDNFVGPWVLSYNGWLEFASGDLPRAKAFFEEMLAVSRDFGMKSSIPDALIFLGEISRYQDDYARALSFYREALTTAQEIGDKKHRIWVLLAKGFIFFRQGDGRRALENFKQSLLLSRETNFTFDSAVALIGMAGLSATEGEPQRAAMLLGVAEAMLDSTSLDIKLNPVHHSEYKGIRALVQEKFDEGAFNRLVAEGRAMAAEGLERVVAYALEKDL